MSLEWLELNFVHCCQLATWSISRWIDKLYSLKWAWSWSRCILTFWQITDNISEKVQDWPWGSAPTLADITCYNQHWNAIGCLQSLWHGLKLCTDISLSLYECIALRVAPRLALKCSVTLSLSYNSAVTLNLNIVVVLQLDQVYERYVTNW